MSDLLINFIIVTYKSTGCLVDCLNSILKNNDISTYQIYIINNAPSDNIDEDLKLFPRLKIIHNLKNIGFANAINKAFTYCTAPFVCILNPDTIIQGDAIQKCIDYLALNSKIGAVGPKVCDVDGTVQGSARSFPTMMTTFFGRTSWLTRTFPNNSLSKKNILNNNNQELEPIEVDWVSGACMIVRWETVKNVGGMDERFFMYWEDADWCRRMREKGWKVVYYPKAAISHACGQSSRTRPLKSIYHFHKSCFQLYEKYLPYNQAIFLPIALVGLSGRMIFMLINKIIKQKLYQNLSSS